MNFQRSTLRYAHTTGYTSLIYIEGAEQCILTCGSDGDLRKWKGIDDDDPTSSCLGEFVICIAEKDGRLLASTDRNTVQAYKLPDVEIDGVLMRFAAPVTCLCTKASYVAAGSEDTNIKVQRFGESAEDVTELSMKHVGPVLAIDISPVKPIMASIGADGQLKIWDLETGAEIKNLIGLPKANSFESIKCYGTPTFEPTGKWLAYANNKEICLLNTETWELAFTLVDDCIRGNYTCCSFSGDGQFLAAGTTSGEISIFDMLKKQALNCESPSSDSQAITSLAWKPKGNQELAYCDVSGQLGMLFSNSDKMISNGEKDQDVEMNFGGIEFDNDDNNSTEYGGDDVDNDDGISIEKLKNSIMNGKKDENLSGDEDTRDSELSISDNVKTVVKTFKQQCAFQPGSTPCQREHRYLVWNDIGIVTAHVEEDGDGSIDVEFHDASVHHALHISNADGHNMASLSRNVLAMAHKDSSKLVCLSFGAAGNKEWIINLPDCESVDALVATDKLIAIATSTGFLRIFTAMGMEREVISLPGPTVSIAGFEDRLMICYHSSPPNETQQFLSAMFIQVKGLTLRTQYIPLPLPMGRQMSWLGFSDCGSPVFGDFNGSVHLFSLKSNCWFPICETGKHSQSISNNYFIISVSELQQIVQAVLCRGSTYPVTNPRPMMQELPMHMPNCDSESEKSELEDALIRASFMAPTNAMGIIKENAIKLFALACRSENDARAKEVVEIVENTEILKLAVKYATKLSRHHLSEKLCDILAKNQAENGNDKYLEEALQISPYVSQPTVVNSSIATRLAPKAMELGTAKRATLKRLSSTPTTSTIGRKFGDNSEFSTARSQKLNNDSQENINTEKIKDYDSQDSNIKELPRSPFNSVNPFAAKRKLDADSDSGLKGILLGANKLKIAKK